MKTKAEMYLTDDDVHALVVGPRMRTLSVRLRVWRGAGGHPLVLAEPAHPDRPTFGPHICRVITFTRHCILKGQDSVFVEHTAIGWSVVTCQWLRHAACEPHRRPVQRSDVEDFLGAAIPE